MVDMYLIYNFRFWKIYNLELENLQIINIFIIKSKILNLKDF